jgi:glycosyltransferase involved in cell wall biosynthesis
MDIALLHNFYRQIGGEYQVFLNERDLLSQKNKVQTLTTNNKISNYKLLCKFLFGSHWSSRSYHRIKKFLKNNDVGVIHVHNFFPLLSPSVFWGAKELGIATVHTLHNYRLIHPGATLMANGEVDERSIKGSAYECIKDKVYHDSYLQTAVVAHMIEYHRKKRTWNDKVDRFIALTDFARNKFIEAGLPAHKVSVKPNFIEDPYNIFPALKRKNNPEGFLFIGRISEEKGISDLIACWKEYDMDVPLYIIGDGPLEGKLKKKTETHNNVIWVGRLKKEKVYKWLSKVKALILPSICFETFGMALIESLAIGTPVITSNIGSQQSIIKDGKTGLHFEVSNLRDLKEKVDIINNNVDLVYELGKNARTDYLENYTPKKNYEMLMNIYQEAIDENNS